VLATPLLMSPIFVFLEDVRIRTLRAAVASWRATNVAISLNSPMSSGSRFKKLPVAYYFYIERSSLNSVLRIRDVLVWIRSEFSAYFIFKVHLYHFSKIKRRKKVTKTVGIKVFLTIFAS
jgi:hypothetical protein